ncbi:MAG: ribbon-helix-helix protein, CopG family [Vicinamibacterales bacterium]
MVKVTFTLDDETVTTLKRLAERSRRPQSQVVREAVAHYAAREAKLDPEEQARLLAAVRRVREMHPTRSQADVDAELLELRRSRHEGWQRPPDR